MQVTPVGGGLVNTVFTVTLTGAQTSGTFYNGSYRGNTGDKIHLEITYTGSNANNAEDVSVQLDIF